MRLARTIEEARLDQGLTKNELARIARVGRSTVVRLINHGDIPARAVTLDRIGSALGWEAGTCAALLAGQQTPGRRPVTSRSAKLVAQRLTEIADEARSAAAVAEQSVLRLNAIEQRARAAVQFVLGGPLGD
ncbi:helix-turn-helix domain-containing protein [Mycobacterium kansasii]|uniref:helix-turn-helix domain-containing protein n=1 Tax=Mycobacterium kansasii TaxID=1768 RepID=UPI0012D2A280|nr:helix-turn-helix transcriptional regulator [Mycobacterium kansasii]